MLRHKNKLIHIVAKNKIASVLFVAAAFLRLYRIGPFTTFLSDQGRDAIIVKRIVTFEHWPAIGAPTSLGHIFLGPFYYYLIAPFLFLSRFDPVGMSVGMAVISIIGIFICYLITRKEFGSRTALFFLAFMTFSSILIEYSRFSWNPNPLPYFSFAAIYSWHRTLKFKKLTWAFISGSLLALCLQLHYLANLLVLPMFISLIYIVITDKNRKLLIKPLIAAAIGFVVFFSPLILFDLKHQFLNSKSFISLFSGKEVSSGGFSTSRILETTTAFFSPAFGLSLKDTFTLFIILSLIGLIIFTIKNSNNKIIAFHAGAVLLYCVGFSYITSFRHPHYYMTIYPSFYLIMSYILNRLADKKSYALIICFLFLVAFFWFNFQKYRFLSVEPNGQVAHAKRVAHSLGAQIGDKPFNIATWPIDFGEDPYLYFLELEGKVPANRELSQVTEQMYVLCNKKPCSIIDSPSWNINMFGSARVSYSWNIEGITIYKLVHER